jgi:hypothetical protein
VPTENPVEVFQSGFEPGDLDGRLPRPLGEPFRGVEAGMILQEPQQLGWGVVSNQEYHLAAANRCSQIMQGEHPYDGDRVWIDGEDGLVRLYPAGKQGQLLTLTQAVKGEVPAFVVEVFEQGRPADRRHGCSAEPWGVTARLLEFERETAVAPHGRGKVLGNVYAGQTIRQGRIHFGNRRQVVIQ